MLPVCRFSEAVIAQEAAAYVADGVIVVNGAADDVALRAVETVADKIAGDAVDASVIGIAVIVNGAAECVTAGTDDVVADEVPG